MTREFFFMKVSVNWKDVLDLTRKCKELHEGCQTFTMQYEYEASIMSTGLPIDEDFWSYIQPILLNIVYYTPLNLKQTETLLLTQAAFTGMVTKVKETKCESELLLRLY